MNQIPNWIKFSDDGQYIYLSILDQTKSEHVPLIAEATYKGIKYTKPYSIEFKGCDVKDCIK